MPFAVVEFGGNVGNQRAVTIGQRAKHAIAVFIHNLRFIASPQVARIPIAIRARARLPAFVLHDRIGDRFGENYGHHFPPRGRAAG